MPKAKPRTEGSDAKNAAVNKADSAERRIHSKLDQRGWFNDVTRGELRDISSTLAQLAPAERQKVVSRLSDSELKVWSNELNSQAPFASGGLPAEERRQLTAMLATSVDGHQLARISKAFTGRDDSLALGDLIARDASPRAQAEFFEGSRSRLSQERVALQVAKVMAAQRDPAAISHMVGALPEPDLKKVATAAAQRSIYRPMSDVPVPSARAAAYHTAPLEGLLKAGAGLNRPQEKSRLLQAAGEVLSEVNSNGSGRFVVDHREQVQMNLARPMAELLSSDTEGVVRSLEHDDRSGRTLVNLNKALVTNEHVAELRSVAVQLQRGNDGKGDPVARFAAVEQGTGSYRNAQVLGYYVGSLDAAIRSVSADRDKQAGYLRVLAAGGLSGGKDQAGVWLSTQAKGLLGVGIAAAGVGVASWIDENTRALKREDKSLREALADLAYPRERSGDPYEGERAESAYDAAIGRVIDRNT